MKWKIERKFREIVLEVGAEEKDYDYVYDKILMLLTRSTPTTIYSTTLSIRRRRFRLFIDTKTKEIWVMSRNIAP